MNTTHEETYTGDCNTCGASHVFDNAVDAANWDADHSDLGHVVTLEEVN